MTQLTKQQLIKALPTHMTKHVNDVLLNQFNEILEKEDLSEYLSDNIISYASVLNDGRFTLPQYMNAVKYVTHKLSGDNNQVAYSKTFPKKYNDWVEKGVKQKDIAAYITIYNKTKLVNLIWSQSQIAGHILHADKFHLAINEMTKLMLDENIHPRERVAAGNSLMTHLKPPEVTKVELDVGIKESTALQELKDITAALAAQQVKAIESGVVNAKEIAHQKILVAEKEEDGSYKA